MANIQIKNADNVAMYRRDIEKAAGRALIPEDEGNDRLIGRMFASDFDYLQSVGLLNRGFCPYCGGSPVDEDCWRSNIHNPNNVKVYLCKECGENNNPTVQFDRMVAGLDLRNANHRRALPSILGVLFFRHFKKIALVVVGLLVWFWLKK
jgi:hypothetical protein